MHAAELNEALAFPGAFYQGSFAATRTVRGRDVSIVSRRSAHRNARLIVFTPTAAKTTLRCGMCAALSITDEALAAVVETCHLASGSSRIALAVTFTQL
jgi:hypothetical protein